MTIFRFAIIASAITTLLAFDASAQTCSAPREQRQFDSGYRQGLQTTGWLHSILLADEEQLEVPPGTSLFWRLTDVVIGAMIDAGRRAAFAPSQAVRCRELGLQQGLLQEFCTYVPRLTDDPSEYEWLAGTCTWPDPGFVPDPLPSPSE
jgi:hypothetical protein